MKLLVDGNEIKVNNDVKVIYEDFEITEDHVVDVHITLTKEGIIGDIIGKDGEAEETFSKTIDEFYDISVLWI